MSPSSSLSAPNFASPDFEIVSAVVDLHQRCPHCDGRRNSRRVHLPPTPQNMEDFRSFTLVELLNEVFVQYNRDWGVREDAQKHYRIAKHLFIRRIRRTGRPAQFAYRYIRHVQDYLVVDNDFDSLVNVDFLVELERNI